MSLQEVITQKNAPYNRFPPLTLKVVALKETTKVIGWEIKGGVARPLARHKNFTAAVSDGSTTMKFVIFNEICNGVQAGKTYIVKNYGLSRFGGQVLLSRHNTCLYKALREIVVSDELENQARSLLAPPSPYKRLGELTSATESLVTIKGTITSVSFYSTCIHCHYTYEGFIILQ